MHVPRTYLSWAETSAVLYLVIPLLIFFACFVRILIAIPACGLIAWLLYELVRRTTWRDIASIRWQHMYFLLLAAAWVWLSGGVGPFTPRQNNDWAKHNLIINLLATHPWPLEIDLPEFGNLTLRYYVGWHLVPALLLRLSHSLSSPFVAFVWSSIGVFLFFSLLPRLVGDGAAARLAPLVFILFGGADFLGMKILNQQVIPPYHLEWWAGWAQFSSNTTALFWSPQQAIPSWLAVALLMHCREPTGHAFLPYCGLIISATALWSPFAAIGLVPFLIVLLVTHGPHAALGEWRSVSCLLLLAVPIGLYLSSGSGSIPSGFAWRTACDYGRCFTWHSYAFFLAVEVGLVIALLVSRAQSEKGFLLAAACALCFIPLYRMGTMNDFAMRASLPALAVIAILCGKLVIDSKLHVAGLGVVLLLAFPGVLGELSRGLLSTLPAATIDLSAAGQGQEWWIQQTFTSQPIWILR